MKVHWANSNARTGKGLLISPFIEERKLFGILDADNAVTLQYIRIAVRVFRDASKHALADKSVPAFRVGSLPLMVLIHDPIQLHDIKVCLNRVQMAEGCLFDVLIARRCIDGLP